MSLLSEIYFPIIYNCWAILFINLILSFWFGATAIMFWNMGAEQDSASNIDPMAPRVNVDWHSSGRIPIALGVFYMSSWYVLTAFPL